MKGLKGKVALVTGGGSGIGRATAAAFATEGVKVVIGDISAVGGEETRQIIRDAGGEAIFVQADVTKAIEVDALVGRAIEAYGRLDYAFNNAGTGGLSATVADFPEEIWDQVINLNLKGVFLCMKYELAQMLKQGSGAIVNTASVAGLVGTEASPAYTASKHGVVGLTKAAALDYATAGIRINAVCPGVIHTPMIDSFLALAPGMEATYTAMHPMGRLGEAHEVAEAVLWLCSDAASFVTGHAMIVDGGLVAR